MTLFHLFLVAAVQGITEFLPVSSSGHLIILPELVGLEDQGQTIDVAAHVGTLGAVVLYFRKDVAKAFSGVPLILRGDTGSDAARLALCLVIATIPVMVAGFILKVTGASDHLRNIAVVGWATLLFGLAILWADRKGASTRSLQDWRPRDAIVIGLWQVLALIPGASRSGVTISGARLLGFHRLEAARISMLMSIPTILAAGMLSAFDAMVGTNAADLADAAVVVVISFIAALAAIRFMMIFLRTVSFTPYVVYRIFLGILLITIAWSQ